ncbi:SPOR domain-containing protein [Parvibaculum sp.]|jgi:cell division septation protein DedD|uniref:SPOR domain-containing protein n=1 Tax=Parvibaculum sp. TaxID=2024848 RepID=UPI003494F213
MSKKPASLTSDLLARKGEAGPSSVDPVSRVTLSPGRQPRLSGIDADEGPSPALYASAATERPDMYGSDDEERPRPPEPEIIYTPEEERGGGRGRLIAGAFVGLALLAGVLVAYSLNGGGSGVAPVSPDLTALPGSAPAGRIAAEAPAAPQAPAEATAEDVFADLRDEEASQAETGPETAAEAPADTAAAPDMTAEAAPVSIAPPASTALEPASAPAPATPEAPVAAAKPAAPAASVAATPASGGAFVVQIMALREEAEVRGAWAALQKKHGSILGGHALDIERADLGDKGIFYRVRAAGFETRAAAISACEKLKAAGQDCMVKPR